MYGGYLWGFQARALWYPGSQLVGFPFTVNYLKHTNLVGAQGPQEGMLLSLDYL